jgi:hypothetical protein
MKRKERRAPQAKRKREPASDLTKAGAPLERLIKEGIQPRADEIAEIGADDGIAVVVFEPSQEWKDALSTHGWKGEAVFPMSDRIRKSLSTTDDLTEKWVANARPETMRLFAIVQDWSLLLNKKRGEDWSIEPGSTDEGL